MRTLTVALACAALALAPGCGGDEESGDETPKAPVPTIPRADPPTDTDVAPPVPPSEEPAPTELEPAPLEPEPDSGGVTVEPTLPDPPPLDSPENDRPPPPGSEAEKFEELCKSNPRACG